MGSCISKCYPNRKPHEETNNNNVQDKLVISQAPITPTPPAKKPLSPYPSPISTSTFSCATSNISGNSFTSSLSSSSSSSSCSSSTISSKERSFSNDFMRSCVKENPHIIGVDRKLVPNKIYVQKLNSLSSKPVYVQKLNSLSSKPVCATPKQSTPKKRARANSPTLTRQKSFRKEAPLEKANGTHSNVPSRTARSPSPSRRFNGENYNYKGALVHTPKEKCSRNYTGKENVRPASPNNSFGRNRASLRNRETHTHRIGTKIDEMIVKEGMSNEDISSIPMEDINNPLIALDCFIFL